MSQSATRFVLTVVLIVAAVFASAAAQAADLSSDEVERFAASASSVQSWLDTQAPALKDEMESAVKPKGMQGMGSFQPMTPEQMQVLSTPVSNIVKGIRAAGKAGELSSVIAGHGFSNADRWGTLGDRVIKAYMTIELNEHGDPRAEMEGTMAELQSSPHMSEGQKTQMMAMIQNSMKMIELMANAPPEDVAAVRPHKSLLKKAFSD